jgi:hypothetical protein
MALVVVGTALAVLSVLAGMAAFDAIAGRADRAQARSLGFVPAEDAATAHLWAYEQRTTWGRWMVTRVDVATEAGAPKPPPGLSRWPRPGEAYVSPELARLLPVNSTLPSYVQAKVTGRISSAGIRGPDELYVYRGVKKTELPRGGDPVVAIGTGLPTTSELTFGELAGLVAFFLGCLGLPLGAFVMVAARLSATTRARRLATLRLLGLSVRQSRRVNSVEVIALTTIGATVGVTAYPLVNFLLARSGLLGVRWFASDSSLSLVRATFVILITVALAATIGSRVVRQALIQPFARRRNAPSALPTLWRLLPLAFGITGLVSQVFRRPPSIENSPPLVPNDRLVAAVVLLTGIGLLFAVSPLAVFVGRLIAVRGPSVAARLAGARVLADPSSSARLVAGILILVFVSGVGIGHSRDARAATFPTTPLLDISLDTGTVPISARPSLLTIPGVAAMGTSLNGDRGRANALVADCRSVEIFAGASFPGYRADRPYSVLESGEGPPRLAVRLDLSEDRALVVPPPQEVVPPLVAAGLAGYTLVVPPASLTGPLSAEGTLQLRVERENLDAVMAAVLQLAPYGQVTSFGVDPDGAERIGIVSGFLRLAFGLAALVTLAAFLVGAVDRAAERRASDNALLVIGVPLATLRSSQMWEAGISLAPGLGVAAIAGVLGGIAWQVMAGMDRTLDLPALAVLAGASAFAGLIALGVAAVSSTRRTDPELLRTQ